MRVRITRQPTAAAIDGILLSQYRVGSVYALPSELATVMIVEGWAQPVGDDVEAELPPIRFQVIVPRRQGQRPHRLHSSRARVPQTLAADKKRK